MATAIERIDPSLTGAYRSDPPLLFSAKTAPFPAPVTPGPLDALPNIARDGLRTPVQVTAPTFLTGGAGLTAPAVSAPNFRADLALLGETIQAMRGAAMLAPKSLRAALPPNPMTAPTGRILNQPAREIETAITQINALKMLEKAALERAAREDSGIGGSPRERILIDTRI